MEFSSSDPAAWVDLTALIDPDLGEADHHATKEAQCVSRIGLTHPAVIFAQSDIQSVMQSALDDPVATLELEETSRIEFFEGEAANEINNFGGFFTVPPNPTSEPGDGLDSRKAHLLRGSLLTIQHANLVSSPVVLPAQGVGLRGRWRGKKAVR